jgi:chromosome segregation ATPase
MGFIQNAKEFLQSKSKKKQAFHDRETELRAKLADLEAKKSQLVGSYDPSKPFDPKAIDKIDTDIEAINKEIAVLSVNMVRVADFDVEELADHIANVKQEASDTIADHLKAEEEARQKIAEAKAAFLKAQANHYNVVRQAKDFRDDTNETVDSLSVAIKQEVRRLRDEAQRINKEIYDMAGDGSSFLGAKRSDQHITDRLQAEYDRLRSEIQRLEKHVWPVGLPISQLDNHRDKNGRTIYFVHVDEQQRSTQNGIY